VSPAYVLYYHKQERRRNQPGRFKRSLGGWQDKLSGDDI